MMHKYRAAQRSVSERALAQTRVQQQMQHQMQHNELQDFKAPPTAPHAHSSRRTTNHEHSSHHRHAASHEHSSHATSHEHSRHDTASTHYQATPTPYANRTNIRENVDHAREKARPDLENKSMDYQHFVKAFAGGASGGGEHRADASAIGSAGHDRGPQSALHDFAHLSRSPPRTSGIPHDTMLHGTFTAVHDRPSDRPGFRVCVPFCACTVSCRLSLM